MWSVQNADWEFIHFFFVWYMITCHLTTNRASRNHFFTIIFHDYLHYCGIFLATFLIIFLKHNFKPSYSLSALCISWLVWCLYRIYQLNMSPLNIKHVQYLRNNWQLCMSCVYFVNKKKCGLRLKLFLWFDIFSTFRGVHPLVFTYMCLILLLAYMRNWQIFIGKSKALLSQLAIWLLSWWFYFSSVWWLHKY